ncbi:uncharacterized protein [Hetaerina americana]|uniref:uncharacterized protein n=1 Tax=Hetaerina americana TaxID=62018 RepID=UPI003A7F3D7F
MVACASWDRTCSPAASTMVVPVLGDEPGRDSGPGEAYAVSQKPKIISELMKRSASGAPRDYRPAGGHPSDLQPFSDSPRDADRPRMCGVLHCARSEWSPRWEPRYLRVNRGSLEVYLADERGKAHASSVSRPRRRLPLRNLSLRRVPRRQHAFALFPREVDASPLILCQADDAESFTRWTRTLAVELMKQTPLGDVRFLDILRITDTPHPDVMDDLRGPGGRAGDDRLTDEVERLKELCQRGGATVHERRRLFEALGSNGGSALDPRKQLSLSRPCTSSEDLGLQPIPCMPLARSRAKRAKSLHDLPSDFPVTCTTEDGAPVSVVSQLRLFFERMGRKGEEARDEGKGSEERSGHTSRITRSPEATEQPKKTSWSPSYSCESVVKSCHSSCDRDNVFLNANQKVASGKNALHVGKVRKDLARVGNLHQETQETPIESAKKDVNMNNYQKYDSFNGTQGTVKMDTVMATESIPLAANVMVSSNSQPSSLSHSLSSESLVSSFLPSVSSPSSSCSSLSLSLSTPSSSPNSQLSQNYYILSVIKKQAAEEEETIWNLQEEMASLDRERIAAHSSEKKVTRKESTTPKKTYGELEEQLHQEELKLNKLYKEAERVLKIIERSVKQDALLASMNHYDADKKWCEVKSSQKFDLRSLAS